MEWLKSVNIEELSKLKKELIEKSEKMKEKEKKLNEKEIKVDKSIWKINRQQQLRLGFYDAEFELNFNNLILKNIEEEIKKQTAKKEIKSLEILKLGHTFEDRKKRSEIANEISAIKNNINQLQNQIQPTQKVIADNINQLNYINNKIVFLKTYAVQDKGQNSDGEKRGKVEKESQSENKEECQKNGEIA